MLLVYLLQLVTSSQAQSYHLPENVGARADCFSKFPYLRNRFSWEQLEFFCQQKRRFDQIIFNETVTPFSTNQLAYLDSLAINYFAADAPNVQVIRKEIRRLSDSERRTLESAMRNLKMQTIDGVSKFDLLVMQHHPALAPGAHVGAAFLPWHREYLRRFETALQQVNRNIALPYWDSTLDEPLIDPLDSVLWTGIFFGNSKGLITDGPYRNWGFRPDNKTALVRLQRNAGVNGSLITAQLRDFILSRASFKELTACKDLTVEQTSRKLHEWVGGAMASMYYSTQDPIFLFHHVYLDFLWGLFRLNQTEDARRNDYPPNYEACTSYHYGQSDMKPFSLPGGASFRNLDGLGPWYGDYYLYEYSPECRTSSAECESKYLFCHPQLKRCVSKIRPGGNCMTFPPEACFDSVCSEGLCEVPGVEMNVINRSPANRQQRHITEPPTEVVAILNGINKTVNSSSSEEEGHMRNDSLAAQAPMLFGQPVKPPNTDPFKGPIVATSKNKQTDDEDVLPSAGRPYVTSKPRPKYSGSAKKQKTQEQSGGENQGRRVGYRLSDLLPNGTDTSGGGNESVDTSELDE